MMVGIGTGWSRNAVLDEFISPVKYRGNAFMFQACLNEHNSRYYDQLSLIFQKGRISPDINNNSASDLYRGSIDWIRAYNLKARSVDWTIYLGFHFLTSYAATSHTVWSNNSYSHNLEFNLGPSLVIDYAPWKKDVHFLWEFSTPMLSYIIRPSLGAIVPEGSIKRSKEDIWGFVTGGRISSLHEYQRIYSNLFVSFGISTRLNIRTGYRWDLQNYTVNNPYQAVMHLMYASIYYRFRK
jgi:hypothetical protein